MKLVRLQTGEIVQLPDNATVDKDGRVTIDGAPAVTTLDVDNVPRVPRVPRAFTSRSPFGANRRQRRAAASRARRR